MKHLEFLSDQQLLDAAVTEFASVTNLPLVFGGYKIGHRVTVSALAGNRTPSLERLQVNTGRGLGGRALAELRPRFTSDYGSSQHITHDYDDQVLGEGVVSLVAIPIIAAGEARAVLYGGAHSRAPLAQVFLKPVSEITAALAEELRIRDEVRRRAREAQPALEAVMSPADREELRAGYAELRAIATDISDPDIRGRLTALEDRLLQLSGFELPEAMPLPSQVSLTRREIDVISHVALGATNAEVATALGLTEGTVKAYLKSVFSKLGSTNRHAAVSAARRERLIP